MRYLSTGIPLVIQAHWFDNDKNRNVIEYNIFCVFCMCEDGWCMKNVKVKAHIITLFLLIGFSRLIIFAGFTFSKMS